MALLVIEKCKRLLGETHVLHSPEGLRAYSQNASALKREIKAVLFPANAAEVQGIVKIANTHKMPLYPISRGKNWGMGSRLPVRDGAVVVELSRMDHIHHVDVEHGYAILEPGVTQGQLLAYLQERALPFVFNATGSGLDSSILGNALDRGIGYFAPRVENLTGLEVVLGDGRLLKTGFGHMEGAKTTHLYKYGLGPGLDDLFTQSNYGIVTRAGFELIRRKESHAAVVCGLDNSADLIPWIDALAELRRQSIVDTVVHIANRDRSEITVAPALYNYFRKQGQRDEAVLMKMVSETLDKELNNQWSAVCGLMGTRARIKETSQHLKRAAKAFGKVKVLNDRIVSIAGKVPDTLGVVPLVKRNKALLEALKPVYAMTKGIPSDGALMSVFWPLGEKRFTVPVDPDESPCGLLYVLPVIPLSGRAFQEAVSATEDVFSQYGFTAYMTLNMLNDKSLECVFNLAFPRDDPGQVDKAHQCIDDALTFFQNKGWMPYRLGIQSMERFIDREDTFWQVVRELKQVFDPNHIIAPGRYNLV